jgi:hypothetical protein
MEPGGVRLKNCWPTNSADWLPGFILSDSARARAAVRARCRAPGLRFRHAVKVPLGGVVQLTPFRSGLVTGRGRPQGAESDMLGGLAALLKFVVAGDGKAVIVLFLFL